MSDLKVGRSVVGTLKQQILMLENHRRAAQSHVDLAVTEIAEAQDELVKRQEELEKVDAKLAEHRQALLMLEQ